ncbi:Uncharacterised protein [Burkholderia pseudomallei]|nr:Uncharacterised protein [Burkholderia pseudomallei]CAJ5176556.1 Uncharacterised protein [Burkholderia pseudomallei]CAJ8270543.1 Uncharacterised protein [Burkholderia pseudomallei]CAJ9484063.1 Uncharacterised protein [Burkholderia pseudomallei]VBL84536.1 Uncharacterised protein [Burkholderia pseudomallei]
MRPEFSRSIWRAVAVGVTTAGLAMAAASCSKQSDSNSGSSSTGGATGGVQPAPMAPSGSSGTVPGGASSGG